MKRRLIWLNLLLLVVVVIAGTTLRNRWVEARKQQDRVLKQRLAAAPPPALPPIPKPNAASPGSYVDVAQKLLLSRDRNPNVAIDPPPPPPPPPPVPPFPVAHGVINLGEGPTAILSEKAGAPHRGYKAGEKVGEFKIAAMNAEEIALEWNGQYFKRRFDELIDKSTPAPPPTQTASSAPPQPPAQASTTVMAPAKPEPGVDMGNERKACQPGDSSPAGTVTNGMKKVVSKTPFGDSCYWEPSK